MQNYILSKEQSLALDMIETENLSLIQFLDKINLSSTLKFSLIKNLKAGKRSLIIFENIEHQVLLAQKIAEAGLSNMMLSLESDDFISPQIVSKIRALHKKTEPNNSHEFVISKFLMDKNHDKILNGFTALTQKIFGDRRWIDLQSIKSRTDKIFTSETLKVKLAFTQHEFWHLRGKIEEAKSLYNVTNQINENILNKFNIQIESEEKVIDLKENLIRYKTKLSFLLQKLDSEIERYSAKIWDQIQKEYLLISEELFKIKLALLEENLTASSQKSSTFFKKKTTQKKYLKLIDENKSILTGSILLDNNFIPAIQDKEETERFVSQLEEQLQAWKENGQIIMTKMIKSLNKNNSDAENLRNIDQEINLLFQEMNDSNLFKDDFENTSMNTIHQYQFLDNTRQNVKILLSYIQKSKDILIWESFFSQLSKPTKRIIELLKKYEISEWIPLFEKWYLEKLIQKYSHPDSLILEDLLQAQYELQVSNNQLEVEVIENKFIEKRNKLAELCKVRNKKMFNDLFKKKGVETLRSFDIIWSEKEMLSNFFPIMLVQAKLFRSNRLLNDGNWDQIYCEDTEIFNHVEKYKILEQKVCFFAPLSDSFKSCNEIGLKIDDKSKISKLLIHEYNYSNTIKSLPISDRLKASKKLAKILLSLNQRVKLYQLKHKSIISLLSPQQNRILTNELSTLGVKEVFSEDRMYEAVTECILEGSNDQFLLYSDYLINPESFEYYLWQLKALGSFKKAGFTLVNLPSIKMKEDQHFLNNVFLDQVKKEIEKENLVQEA